MAPLGRSSAQPRRSHRDDDGGPVDELLGSLRRLPFEQRAVVILRDWLDREEADIADTLRSRRSTVRTRAKRGLARLRALLEDGPDG